MSNTMPQTPLTDEIVMNGFHIYLKNALAQAKAERLLEEDLLSSAEADIMISGPALCLFFACLRSTTTPPSVPLPRSSLPSGAPPLILNMQTCPQMFQGLLALWAQCVPTIQALPGDQQHDLARIICGREPISQSTSRHATLKRLAADLRAVAIEISQRRTFQERYQEDLQAALDHTVPGSPPQRTPSPFRATFVPPPMYDAKPSSSAASSAQSSPRNPNVALSPTSPNGLLFTRNPDPSARGSDRLPNPFAAVGSSRSNSRRSSPAPPTVSLPSYSRSHTRATSAQTQLLEPPSAGRSSPRPSSSRPVPRPPSPTILVPSDPAILTIRETLYAAIADVLARTSSIKRMLLSDPPRAYFSAVGLAILEFSLRYLNEDGSVNAVLGKKLEMSEVPADYKPLMAELGAVARRVVELEEEDNNRAIQLLSSGVDDIPTPRMERVRRMLEKGVTRGWEEAQAEGAIPEGDNDEVLDRAGTTTQRRRQRGRSRSPSGTALQLTNRINGLALAMTRLPAFQERQSSIFKILVGVTK